MDILRPFPPLVAQTLPNSCWAAVIDSWSQADHRLNRQTQSDLIARFGEDSTGGITPQSKIPLIASFVHRPPLGFGAFSTTNQLLQFIRTYLCRSLIFCAYTIAPFTHAILIYRLGDEDFSFMDPNGGTWNRRPLTWLNSHAPFVVMRIR